MAYIRKTHDEFDVEGHYGDGWEVVCSEDTRKEAKQRLKEYNENEPQYPHRIKKHRVKNEIPTAA